MQKIVDKFFTWGSNTVTPNWCQTEYHWTSRITSFMWTDCPCCLMFRGIIIGAFFGVTFMLLVMLILSKGF